MSDSIYRPLIDSMQWSYSRIKLFDTCRYAWYLKYLFGEPEEPNFYASYGSFVHKLIEKYYRDEISCRDLQMKFLVGFPFSIKGKHPKQSIVEKYIEAGSRYFKNFAPFPYDMVFVEKEVEFDVGGNKFIGYVDYVGERDGELVVIDHKSRDLSPRSGKQKPTAKDRELDEFLRQLYLYAVGIERLTGKLPTKLCFNCFKSGVFIEEPFDAGAFAEAKQWAVDQIERIKEADKFYPNIDWFYCTNLCGYNKQCCYYQTAYGGGNNER